VPIRRHEPWGQPGVLSPHGVVVRSDAEAHDVVVSARRSGAPIPPIGLLGGDLCHTVGGRGDADRLRNGLGMVMPCDLVAAQLDDGPTDWFVAHLVAHRGWWRGRAFVAMNAAWLGPWNLGPKAHPNDGLVDVTDARVRPGQRLAVRRRLPTGSHLPHPGLTTRRVRAGEWVLDRSTPIRLDGVPVGTARRLRLTVEPDAFQIVV
jgi:hypothetical protein